MKFFLDTADLAEIEEAASWGALAGVTTNPSLYAKIGGKLDDFHNHMKRICDIVGPDCPVSAESVAMTRDEIVADGRKLAEIAPNIVVKIPTMVEGLAATHTLAAEGIPVNMTLCFSVPQALLAARAGARYISPFIGRFDDISEDGLEQVGNIVTAINNYDFTANTANGEQVEIIAASVRSANHVTQCALMGADIATVPFGVLKKMVQHPLTDRGLDSFMKDWEKVAERMSDEQNVAEAPQQGAPAADAAPAAPKRRPGRPRKSAASSGKASSEASSDAASDAPVDRADSAPKTPAKRRPGRPRKKAAPAQKAESVPAAKAASAAKAKKAKEAPAEPEAAASKAQAAEAAQPVEAVTGTPARRRPGRSHKKIATAPVAAQAVPAQDASGKQQAPEAAETAEAVQAPAEAAGSDQQAPAKDMAPGRAARAARTPRKSVRAQGANREGRSEQHEGRGKSDAREGAERTEGRSSGNAGADRHQRNDRGDRNGRKNGNDRNDRHQRHQRNNNREVVPSVNKEDLAKLKVAELRAKAAELDVDVAGLKKAELIDAVYDASLKAEGFVEVEGILDIMPDGYGFLRTNGYLPSEHGLLRGAFHHPPQRPAQGRQASPAPRARRAPTRSTLPCRRWPPSTASPSRSCGRRVRFGDLTPVYPDECLTMEHGQTTITARVIDLVSPIGKGQRGLIVSPPKAGKTTILKDIAAAITRQQPRGASHVPAGRRAPRGSHGHAALHQGRGHLLHLRHAHRKPHRRCPSWSSSAPSAWWRTARTSWCLLDCHHAPGARLQPGAARIRAHPVRRRGFHGACTRPRSSWARPATSRAAAA